MVSSAGNGVARATADQILITVPSGAHALSPEQIEQVLLVARVVVQGASVDETRWQVIRQLAERSFIRSLDPMTLTGDTMVFEQTDDNVAETVLRYERALSDVARAREESVTEVREARHRLLMHRDHVIGTEAEIGRINRDVVRLNSDLVKSRKRLRALTQRRDALTDRVSSLQARLTSFQRRNKELRAENDRLVAAGVPLSRLVLRRIRRTRG